MPSAGLDGLDVEIDRPSDGRRWPGLRIQPEVTQDPSSHFALAWLDERDHLHPPAAPGAGERIDLEDTLDELRPAPATRGPAGRARVVDVDGELAGRLPTLPSTPGSQTTALVGTPAVDNDNEGKITITMTIRDNVPREGANAAGSGVPHVRLI